VGVAISDGDDPAAAAISAPVPSQRFQNHERRFATAMAAAATAADELMAQA
jgi:DNA-binding IclR family transcriptional regulator